MRVNAPDALPCDRHRNMGGLPMKLALRNGALGLVLLAAPAPGFAAESSMKVALLDMTSLMPAGMPAYGMMGQGMGMMGPGMMGQGMGMMGQGMGMMGMMAVRLDRPGAKAGQVDFEVTNWSRSLVHEFLVVSVDSATAPLPYDYSKAQVAEDQVKVVGEVDDLQPNASKTLTLTLAPGSYLLICNVAGHYASGMVAPLTVAN
jgi:uncharacterized cupredoxin-like copper-binding protein